MEGLIGAEIIFMPIGWIYLWIKYRNKTKVKAVLAEKYENSYGTAGMLFCGRLFGAIFLLLIIGLICGCLYGLFMFAIL